MTEIEIFDVLKEILKAECEITKEISMESTLMGDLGLDSVGILTMASTIENRFQIFLNEDVEHPPQTVKDVIHLILLRQKEQSE